MTDRRFFWTPKELSGEKLQQLGDYLNKWGDYMNNRMCRSEGKITMYGTGYQKAINDVFTHLGLEVKAVDMRRRKR